MDPEANPKNQLTYYQYDGTIIILEIYYCSVKAILVKTI